MGFFTATSGPCFTCYTAAKCCAKRFRIFMNINPRRVDELSPMNIQRPQATGRGRSFRRKVFSERIALTEEELARGSIFRISWRNCPPSVLIFRFLSRFRQLFVRTEGRNFQRKFFLIHDRGNVNSEYE